MNQNIRLFWTYVVVALLLSCNPSASDEMPEPDPVDRESNHPFLIVKKEQFAALRQKGQEEPWKSMKIDAIQRSRDGYRRGTSNSTNAYQLQYYIGAAALAYILDEANAQTHADRVRDAILNHYSQLEVKDGGDWGGVVPNMGSFFSAILALDIVYDALSLDEIRACEEVISEQIFKIDRKGSWADVRYGTHGTWDIYRGDRTEPDDDYYNGIMYQITEDGVSPVTIHYAWERVGGGDSRVSKSGYMDVLEFTGIDRRYYQNERLQKFQRWLFGSSINNAKEMAIIGDMLPTQGLGNYLLLRRVVNFDQEAAAYAAWFLEGQAPKGHILTYIVPKEDLPPAQTPESAIFTNGGAFLRESPADPDGVHAVLYNIKSQDEWHTHQEINGLALSAYGNRVLVNGGRLGAPTRPAPLNNTLTINGEEHQSRLGGGIVDGFTSIGLDYACGDAGRAISGKMHQRSMVLVHASTETQAYCLIIDEVMASPGDQVHTYYHPANQSQVYETTAGGLFEAAIDHHPSQPGAKLLFFYITPPEQVMVEKVPSAVPDRYPGYPDHNRLEAIYRTDEEGKMHALNLLYPQYGSQPKPAFSRINDGGLSGGLISREGIIEDYFFTTTGEKVSSYQDLSFQAKAILYRQTNDQLAFYFVRQGTYFSKQAMGFEADAPLSIYQRTDGGSLSSPGTRLTLYGPNFSSLQFEPPVDVISLSNDTLEIDLPAGIYHFN